MKLKLIGVSLIVAGLLISSGISFAANDKTVIPSSFLYQAVNKYKQKNYTGCIQDMEYIIKKGKATDIAYYYQAISYAQLGMNDKAKEAYEAAIRLSSDKTLVDYANQAVICIDDSTQCDSNLDEADITKFIKSDKFMHDDVQQGLQKNALDRVKSEINSDSRPDDNDLKYLNQNNEPTDKEIADAVRTLSKLGINPIASNGYSMWGQNPEMMQMNALMGNQNNNNNNMMNLIPMISAMQSAPDGKNKINKEFVQAYMINQMLPSFNFGNNDK